MMDCCLHKHCSVALMVISDTRWLVKVLALLILPVLLSGCATIMLQLKVDPSRSFTQTGTAPLIYVSFNDQHIYVATERDLYRFDRPPGSHDEVVKRMQRNWIPNIAVRKEGLGEYRANFVLAHPIEEQEQQSQLLRNGKRLKKTPKNMIMLPLSGVESVDLYKENRRSIAKRGAYRAIALVAGVGIDHLIISQPWTGGEKVFAEIVAGYAIGCWGVDPKESPLC